jgi:hypothetical protein
MWMKKENNISNIADSSKPNAGRIYDYFLGGNHNFEIDRQAAQPVLQTSPFLPRLLRLIRWFLGEATRRLCEEGYTKFLDFASGLPTVDHIHQVAPKGTKVIYSDIDPVTVAYANDIIGDNPNVRYVHCDAGKPEDLLNSGVIEELFGKDRKLAIGFNGIAWFLPDEPIDRCMNVLYDWAEKGSKLFTCDADSTGLSEEAKTIMEQYKKFGQPFHPRTMDRLKELLKPWSVTEPGFIHLEKWMGMEKKVTKETQDAWSWGGIYGVLLTK